MEKLEIKSDGLYITRRTNFNPITIFKESTIEKVFDFAYSMSFGKLGEHRNHRSGGTHIRKNGEIFANTFQGKLSEFALYNQFYKNFDITIPDLDTYGLGEWDNADFILNNRKISVKSTKSFGNLLLLETKDWNNKGEYIPNLSNGNAIYDFHIFIRIEPFCEDLLKELKALYSNDIDKEKLKSKIINNKWEYDIPGYITKNDLIDVISNNNVINKGDMLNGRTKMDADNYYVQSGDMRPILELYDELKK